VYRCNSQPIARFFRPTSVGIVDIDCGIGYSIRRHHDNSIGANAGPTIANFAGKTGKFRARQPAFSLFQQQEIVAESVILAEPDLHSLTISVREAMTQ
jgi:hypothetical protein